LPDKGETILKMKKKSIKVMGTEISIIDVNGRSYISLTDIIKPFGNEMILYNWLRNKNTIEFLGLWEILNNPSFKGIEFDRFKKWYKRIAYHTENFTGGTSTTT
jgi:hypothetical protein